MSTSNTLSTANTVVIYDNRIKQFWNAIERLWFFDSEKATHYPSRIEAQPHAVDLLMRAPTMQPEFVELTPDRRVVLNWRSRQAHLRRLANVS